jgi:streptogramin lyase
LDVDSKGNVWYANTGWDYFGKLDPTTARFTEYPSPTFSTSPQRTQGIMDVQIDKDDNLFLAVAGPRAAKFDTKTEQWTFWDLPSGTGGFNFLAPFHGRDYGTHWANGVTAAYRLNVVTGKADVFTLFQKAPPGPHWAYMIDRDSQDNAYFTDFRGSNIGRIDAKTGEEKLYPTLTPNAFPRRGYIDAQDRFWFGEFWGDKIGVFDTKTERIKEFDVPHPYMSPYYARPDRNGDIWVSTNGSDRLLRLNEKSGEIVQYLMPTYYDARKVGMDPSPDHTTVWLPNKNTSQFIRVQPLD